MTISRSLAILPVGQVPGDGWPAAVVQRLFNPSEAAIPLGERTSVSDFFADCALGVVQVTGHVTGPTSLPADDADWLVVRTGFVLSAQRSAALARLAARCRDAGAAFGPDDLLVVLGSLPSDRDFQASVRIDGRVRRVAYMSTSSSHATMVHEVGHLIGLAHPYGLLTNGAGELSAEYGSPYCVMGRAGRAAEVATTLTPWSSWPGGAPVPLFGDAGPRLSMAELVAWSRRDTTVPQLPATTVRELDLPADGWEDFTVGDQDAPAGVPRAVLARTADGHRLLVEVRRPLTGRPVDWDAALDLRRPIDGPPATSPPPEVELHGAPGVVIHRLGSVLRPDPTLEDIRDGSAWAHDRPIYLGVIPLPVAGDTDVSFLAQYEWTVQVLADRDGVVSLRAGGSVSLTDRTVRIVPLRHQVSLAATRPAGDYDVSMIGPRCELGTFTAERLVHDHDVLLQAMSSGMERPEFRWTVGGVELPWCGVGKAVTRGLDLAVAVDSPTGYREWTTAITSIRVYAVAGWDQLRISVPGADVPGRVRLRVRCEVRETGTLVPVDTVTSVEVEAQRLRFPFTLEEGRRQCTAPFVRVYEDLRERFPDLEVGAVLDDHGIKIPPEDWNLAQWEASLARLARSRGIDPGSLIRGGAVRRSGRALPVGRRLVGPDEHEGGPA